ncbi:MAG TPA: hypothetical protein VKD69_06390 [Vicinamibacterales bacterium]|nr:hypothetical protein [Vicinamibacterales bacterium]
MTVIALALASGLLFTTPDGWKSSPPASSMRVAEFTLPHVAGDAEDAQLIVYYFGGSGGSVDANMQRWLGQMQQPDGKPSSAVAKKESRKVNGLTVSLVDVSGTYTAEMSPGSAAHHDNAHFRMRAGVVETPQGLYFIKLTGPEKTVAKWDAAFNQFVGSLRTQ